MDEDADKLVKFKYEENSTGISVECILNYFKKTVMHNDFRMVGVVILRD
jgi:hypothetical protein